MTQRKILLICGSHRSGTSALTGTLQNLDWTLPKTLMQGSRWNPKGYFESTVIRDFHDEVLEYLDRPVYDLRETAADVDFEALMRDRSKQMSALLRSEFGDAKRIMIKDPRLCRLLPLWKAYAGAEGYDSHVILSMRHPDEVAASLHRRNGFSISEGLLIWMRESLLAETQSSGMSRGIVYYADLLADWKNALSDVLSQLGLEGSAPGVSAASRIEEFLSPEFRVPADVGANGAAETWPRELALRIFAAIGQEKDAQDGALDVPLAIFNTATRMMGGTNQPGHATHRAIAAIGPAMDILMQSARPPGPSEADIGRAVAGETKKLKSLQEATEKKLAQSQAKIEADIGRAVADETKKLKSLQEATEEKLAQSQAKILDLQELSSGLMAENEELQLSLKDRFMEIADLAADLEQVAAENKDLLDRYKKMDKSYKELKSGLGNESSGA